MPRSTPKRGNRDQQSRLRGLAGEKGYEVVHALRSDGWHVLDARGKQVSDNGHTTFTILQAMELLRKAPVAGLEEAPARAARSARRSAAQRK